MPSATNPSENGAKQEQDTKSETSEALTAEKVNELINTAFTHRSKQADKRFAELLDARLSAITSKPEEKTSEAPKADDSQPWQKEIEKLNRKLQESEKKARDATRAGAEKEAMAQLRAELASSNKLRADGIDAAARLIRADGRIRINDEGSFAYVHEDQEVSIAEGVKEYLKSKDAALFIAPPKAGGSTTTRGPSTSVSTLGKTERSALNRELISKLPKE